MTSHVGLGVGPELTLDTLLTTSRDDFRQAEQDGGSSYEAKKQRVRLQAGATITLYVSF